MMKMIAAAAAIAVSAGAANAALVDFTDTSKWSGQNAGATTVANYSGFQVTLSSVPANFINFTQPFDGPAGAAYCAANGGELACGSDGLGVVDDEVTAVDPTAIPPNQSVTLTFSNPVNILGADFLDLFLADDGSEAETAELYFDGDLATLMSFSAVSKLPENGGFASSTFLKKNVTSVTFFSSLLNDNAGAADVALAALRVEAVPLPAAAWMLMAAVGGLGLMRRRKPA